MRNQIGQKIGAKGSRTRQTIIATTLNLLETHGLRDLTVAEIARSAALSPATFYVYFEGVPEVLLAALDQATQSSPDLMAMLDSDWTGPDGYRVAQDFVALYCAHWQEFATVFRCRNLASEEGDVRFQTARRHSVSPLIEALSACVARAQVQGRVPLHLQPRASASAILTLLERLAAIGPTTPEQPGMNFATLKDAAAHMVAIMMGATFQS
jgi:AcrR family transcriptional regulator